MANRVQHLRGSLTEHSTFTGEKGEISLVTDTSANRIPTGELRIHDGSTAGGLVVPGVARAWVNFNGTVDADISGTYSQSGLVITFTFASNHNLIAGNQIYPNFATGTASAEVLTVDTVVSDTVVTANSVTSRTTSGDFTANFNQIRASYNVASITDNGTGDYTVNFTTAMPDANYCVNVSCEYFNSDNDPSYTSHALIAYGGISTNSIRVLHHRNATGSEADFRDQDTPSYMVSIFR